jgi:hypothetical protein
MDVAGLFRAGQGHAPRLEPLVGAAVRVCGEYLVTAADRERGTGRRLAGAIGALVAAHTAGTGDDVFDLLLRTAERALEAGEEPESRLALSLAETATHLRARSKGAWRLRGLALEALGRDDEAIEAYERHLALQQSDRAGQETARRLAALRETRACLEQARRLFPGDFPERFPDDGAGAHPAAAAREAFTASVQARLAERGAGDPAVRGLVALHATHRRLTLQGRTADPLLGGTEPIGVSALRNLIAGRTVCLVAGDAEDPPARTTGAYDLVVRLDALRPAAPGDRTDVHALTLRGETPWEGPGWSRATGVRLVFAESARDWRRAVRRRLVPGAQTHVGDASLRGPVGDPALVGDPGWAGATTCFTMIRLLDFLDVSPRIDLLGPGLTGRLRPKEREWVMAHARETDPAGTRTALR